MTSLATVTNRTPAEDPIDRVCRRVKQLQDLHAYRSKEKDIIRAVCSSPEEGLRAILGDIGDTNPYAVPAANLVLRGLTRLGQKLGRVSDLRIDPPDGDDRESARKKAEKRAQLVTMWDDETDLERTLDQSGLWLPGYAFTAWVIKEAYTEDGDPYPGLVNLDPYGTYPAPTVGNNQPSDLAYIYRTTARELAEKYPPHRIKLLGERQSGGGILLDTTAYPSGNTWFGQSSMFGNPSGAGLDVAEYYNKDGCWVVVPEKRLLLEFYENPLPSPQFIVGDKISFSRPVGQYDHSIGLQTLMGQMRALMAMAFQDGVETETNVYGNLISGQYRRGRFAINYFDPGTRVERPPNNLPYQFFQAVRDMEEQFRVTAGYSPVDDAISPAAQATGQGIDRLTAGLDLEVKQYFKTLRRMTQLKDRKQLQWAEACYSGRTLHLSGVRKGISFAGSYEPGKDIAGQYRTRRTYGVMAGLDDHNKISALAMLTGAELFDRQSAIEELDKGDRSVSQIMERIEDEKVRKFLMEAMVSGQPLDPRVAMTLIAMLPESEFKEAAKTFWTPDGPQMSPEEEAMIGAAQAPQGPPDLAAMLGMAPAAGGAPAGAPPMPMGAVA